MAEDCLPLQIAERLLRRNFLDYGGEILNLQILQRPSSINSPEQTLRMLSPAAATCPKETLNCLPCRCIVLLDHRPATSAM